MWYLKNQSKYFLGYQIVDEFPSEYKPKEIYIEGNKSQFWTAAFICPCGCNQIIYLNLLRNTDPYWVIHFHWYGRISIYPSIKRVVGCNSHFSIYRSRIQWHQYI